MRAARVGERRRLWVFLIAACAASGIQAIFQGATNGRAIMVLLGVLLELISIALVVRSERQLRLSRHGGQGSRST